MKYWFHLDVLDYIWQVNRIHAKVTIILLNSGLFLIEIYLLQPTQSALPIRSFVITLMIFLYIHLFKNDCFGFELANRGHTVCNTWEAAVHVVTGFL